MLVRCELGDSCHYTPLPAWTVLSTLIRSHPETTWRTAPLRRVFILRASLRLAILLRGASDIRDYISAGGHLSGSFRPRMTAAPNYCICRVREGEMLCMSCQYTVGLTQASARSSLRKFDAFDKNCDFTQTCANPVSSAQMWWNHIQNIGHFQLWVKSERNCVICIRI